MVKPTPEFPYVEYTKQEDEQGFPKLDKLAEGGEVIPPEIVDALASDPEVPNLEESSSSLQSEPGTYTGEYEQVWKNN